MSMIKVLPNLDDPSATWPNLPMEAKECALTYCVNRYSSSIVNGTLSEMVSSNLSTYQRDPRSWQVDTSGYGTMNATMANSLAYDSYYSWFRRTDLRLGDKLNVSQSAVNSISHFLQSNFAADLSDISTTYVNHTYSAGYPMLNGFYMNNGDAQWRPGTMEAFYYSNNFSSTFGALAKSMSNAIRDGHDVAETIMTGLSGVQIIYYDIEWPWISLHCFVTLIGMVFLIMTMLRSKKVDAPMYGSSIPAIIPEGGFVKAVQATEIRGRMLVIPDQGTMAQGRMLETMPIEDNAPNIYSRHTIGACPWY
jgi:hypothetical protein